MTTTSLKTLVDELERAGAVFAVDGSRTTIDAPEGIITDDVRQQLREHKAQVRHMLTGEQTPYANHPGFKKLLGELRTGQQWLTRHYELGLSGNNRWASNGLFSDILAEWDQKDQVLRSLFEYTGCIWEPSRCPDESPSLCRRCERG